MAHGLRRAAPLARYTLLWSGAAAIVVLLALSAMGSLGGGGDRSGTRPALPAGVPATARAAGCSFTRIEGPARRAPASPPSVGAARVRPALDGAYAQPPSVGSLVGALARGRVVIQYRSSVTRRQRALLERLYGADRTGVILTPDQTGMDDAVAATAWRRVLACPRIDGRVLAALAEFRDHFRGHGAR